MKIFNSSFDVHTDEYHVYEQNGQAKFYSIAETLIFFHIYM